MGVILDTSVLISLEKSGSSIDEFTAGREAEPFGISVVSVSELLHGVHRADSETRRVKRESYVERMIDLFPSTPLTSPREGFMRESGQIWRANIYQWAPMIS